MSDDNIDVKKLVEGINKGFEEFKSANDERLKELETKGGADPVLEEKLGKIEADMAKLEEVNDKLVMAAKRAERFGEERGETVDLESKAAHFGKHTARAFGGTGGDMDAKGLDAYAQAANRYLRKGDRSLTELEVKALSVGGDPDGGYVVHPDMTGRMVKQVYETSVMRAYASVQTISTDTLEGLYDNDEAGFGWVEETESRPTTDTPQLGKWSIPVHEMYANPAATQKILDDAEINIEQWLAMKVADRFSRAENNAFVVGNGIGKPRGFLDYADGSDLTNSIERINTGVDGDFAAAPAGGDTLITALYSLKAPYMAQATWFMRRSTMAAVRKLKDSDGAYLWMPGIAAGQPASIFGYPVAPAFEDMPAITTGSVSIAVGDMRAAYQIVDRTGIRVLRDPYTNKPYVHFYSTKRTGGAMVNGESLKLVEFSAS